MTTATITKVLIISNQILYTEALKSLLIADQSDLFVDAYSTRNPNLDKVIKEDNPNLILLDANGMGKNIWNFLHSTHTRFPDTGIIMLANSNEAIYQEYASKNGAQGYVLKTSPKELLIAAMKIVMRGGQFFDPGSQGNKGEHSAEKRLQRKFNLGGRETEIVQLIKDGMSTKDIANHLGLSFHTIESHRKNIYNKLNIKKVTELLLLFNEVSDSE